jgi:hypothetical protein
VIVWRRSASGHRKAHAFRGDISLCGRSPEVVEDSETDPRFGQVCGYCEVAFARDTLLLTAKGGHHATMDREITLPTGNAPSRDPRGRGDPHV